MQYWHHFPAGRPARRDYLGKKSITKICKGKRPDVQAPIVQDQRGVGLLGRYIESLRGIAFVKANQILIDEEAMAELLGDPRFEWSGNSPGSWETLSEIFAAVDLRPSWPKLGRRLFSLTDQTQERIQMNSTAKAVGHNPKADWLQLARKSALLEPQKRIAVATDPTTHLETLLREMFGELLKGHNRPVAKAKVRILGKLATQIIKLEVINTVWPSQPPLAQTRCANVWFDPPGTIGRSAAFWTGQERQLAPRCFPAWRWSV